jgi:hypothetical protein
MDANTQQVPGYFVWEASGKPLVVHLSLNVVDRMSVDILRGLGSVPKRGAEVGGILLGSIESPSTPDGRTVVHVDDFENVSCEYARGPSYLLSEGERAKLESVVERAQPNPRLHAIGYYRSHTRDGPLLPGDEDRETFWKCFSTPTSVALLVRPFAAKVSTAAIFVAQNGELPAEAPAEFPFRRREMAGDDIVSRRAPQDRGERPERPRRAREEEVRFESLTRTLPEVKREPLSQAPLAQAPPLHIKIPPPLPGLPSRPKNPGWVWVPFCFLFLLLGVGLGYESAVTLSPATAGGPGQKPFLLNLTAGRNGNTLTVRWDRDSQAIRAAERGVLEIVDGGFAKPVPLDLVHLREGTVVYQNTTASVTFRLVVYMNPNLTVNETVQWFQ